MYVKLIREKAYQITNDLEALYLEKSFKLYGILFGNIVEVLTSGLNDVRK